MDGCKHLWHEVKRTYTRPMTDLRKVSGHDSDLIKTGMYGMYGMTVVKLRCIECGDIKFVTTPGKAR